MSKAKRSNKGFTKAMTYIAITLVAIFAMVVVLAMLDIAGAMLHTAFSAAWNGTSDVTNYVMLKRENTSIAHTIIRAVIAAFLLMQLFEKLDSKVLHSVIARLFIFAVLLALLDFSAYVVEYLGVALWRAIITGFREINVRNIIQLEYLEKIDVLARFGQAFVCANVYFLWMRERARRAREERIAYEERETARRFAEEQNARQPKTRR